MQLVEVTDQHQTVEHRDAHQRDEAHRGRHTQVFARDRQRDHAADHCERNVGEHQQRLLHRAQRDEQQQEDQGQGHRHHDREPRRSALLVLELAAPGQPVTGR